MSKTQKRIEALNELFMSEKAYIADLSVWEKDFRREILSFPFLSLKVKYEICDLVFINMHEIKALHEDIFKDMRDRNVEIRRMMEPGYDKEEEGFILDKDKHEDENIIKLEYATIYFKHASRFKVYEEYVRRLSRADFELEKITHYSLEFRIGLHKFMSEHNIEFLGTKHFIYRPSQKLARYPLLLKAVLKNTEIVTYEKYYTDLIEEIKYITKNVDNVFNKYSTQFKIYRLDQQLKYRPTVKNQLCIGLFQKKRRLYKEGEILVKTDVFFDPFVLKVYVFDHVILLCDIQQGEFQDHYILDDPIFISKVVLFKNNLGFYPENDDLTSFSPLYILDTSTNRVRCFYFEDEESRNIYFRTIKKAMRKIRGRFDPNIRLEKLFINLENDVNNACKSNRQEDSLEEETVEEGVPSEESSLSSSEEEKESEEIEESVGTLYNEQELKRAISEYTNGQIEENRNPTHWRSNLNTLGFGGESQKEEEGTAPSREQEGWFKRMCHTNDFFNRSFKYEIREDAPQDLEFLRKQDEMVLTSSTEGIMKIIDQEKTLIYDKPVSKVLYDSAYEVIIFQSGSTLYIAQFNCEMDTFEQTALKNDIGDFFYGTTKRGSYIASRNYGGGKSSLIYLFLIEKKGSSITVDLSRKLYVGFKVYNIFFSREKIVIACKDFEVVDMDTLRTEELLETYDPFINIFFRSIPMSKARAVFPITKNTYLLCFDSLGFIVDLLGRIRTTDRIFLWNCLPVDFKVFYDYVICVGKKCVDVYDLKTGELIFTYLQNGLKFVKGTDEPLLHDSNDFYNLYL